MRVGLLLLCGPFLAGAADRAKHWESDSTQSKPTALPPMPAQADDNSQAEADSFEKGQHFDFWPGFVASLLVTMVSELGDKTWFIAAILAMRHSRLAVFSGAMTANAVMTALSDAAPGVNDIPAAVVNQNNEFPADIARNEGQATPQQHMFKPASKSFTFPRLTLKAFNMDNSGEDFKVLEQAQRENGCHYTGRKNNRVYCSTFSCITKRNPSFRIQQLEVSLKFVRNKEVMAHLKEMFGFTL